MRNRSVSSSRRLLLEESARCLRSAPTLSEQKLWSALRGSRLGVAFRRQAVVGGFIVDFLAPSVRLVVEVDGGYHERRRHADAKRDALLARLGFRVARVSSDLVVSQFEVAVAQVLAAIHAR